MSSTSIARVRIAVVGGSGLIGTRHCQLVASSDAAQLVAMVDPSPQASNLAKSFNTALYPSVEALLASSDKPPLRSCALPITHTQALA